MAFQGSDNLREYLAFASLPEMKLHYRAPALPPPGHKSHLNHLNVVPKPYRCLEQVYHVNLFDDERHRALRKWLSRKVPYTSEVGIEDTDPTTGKRLTLPCPENRMFGIQEQHQQWPVTTAHIVSWLENLPLVTAARAFHIMHPERIGWDFIPDAGDHDRTTFQHILWTLPRTDDCDYSSEEEQRIGEESVAVIVQPPWILSDQDIMEFCSRQSFPDYVAPGNAFPRPFTSSKQRAWAKVWDTCVRSHVRWFVVTSYHKWVFGKFSQGYSGAHVIGPLDYNAHNPSIVELLVSWMCAPLDPTLAKIIPQFPEASRFLQQVPIIIPSSTESAPKPTDSESNWSGKDDDAMTSAGMSRYESPSLMHRFISPDGIDMAIPPIDRQKVPVTVVNDWIQSVGQAGTGQEIKQPMSVPRRKALFPALCTQSLQMAGITLIPVVPGAAAGDWLV